MLHRKYGSKVNNEFISALNDDLTQITDDVHGVKNYETVAAENLNTYTTPGVYCVFLSSSSSPLLQGELYCLEVFAVKYGVASGYVQRLNRVYPISTKVYQRAYYSASGSWSAWTAL